jgi:hypothetical protein
MITLESEFFIFLTMHGVITYFTFLVWQLQSLVGLLPHGGALNVGIFV